MVFHMPPLLRFPEEKSFMSAKNMLGLPMKPAMIVMRRKSWLTLFWIFLSRSSHGRWGYGSHWSLFHNAEGSTHMASRLVLVHWFLST